MAADELYDGPFCVLSVVDARRQRRLLYEVLDRYVPKVGVPAMLRELERARSIWDECRYRRRAVRAVA